MSEEGVRLGRGSGPLRGVRVVEIAGIGPAPHACMLLSDLGADVIRVERPGGGFFATAGRHDVLNRGRPSVVLDLGHPDAVRTVLDLVSGADVLVEGQRPGALERRGLGPEDCWARNPRLVYARMTGWGQDGPWAEAAGHDLNYLAVTGALHAAGQDPARPHFPTNLIGDFGGGSTYLVIGVLAGLLEARTSGRGQVVDAAIVDGVASLNAMATTFAALGLQPETRASGLLDGGTPWYDLYETADGRHLSVGPLEPRFYDEMIRLLELEDVAPDRDDPAHHDELRRLLADTFARRTQEEWAGVFAGTDACVVPVLPLSEAVSHEQLAARGTYVELDGLVQPAPAPRLSRTPGAVARAPASVPGADTRAALTAWGIEDVEDLLASGAAVQAAVQAAGSS